MLRCKECGSTKINKVSYGRATWVQNNLDKNGNSSMYPYVIHGNAEETYYECVECGNESSYIDEITKWE